MEHSSRQALEEIRSTLTQMGRDVTIVAVSKTHGPERIDELAELGLRDFGENRYTEARDKFPEVHYQGPLSPLIYHHIGPLQSGFARNLPGLFHWVHGASSVSAINKLARAADKYEALYQRITAPASRQAADALFSVTGEELRQTYKPGKTETQ